MAAPFTLPEVIPPTVLYQGAANAVACDTVSFKNLIRGWFVVIHTGANDTDLVLTLKEATDVASGTNQTVQKDAQRWQDLDAGTTSDVLARIADGTGFTIDPATMNGVVLVFEWDPSRFSEGYDCAFLGDSGGHASNVCTILFFGLRKDQQKTPLTVITD